MIKGLAITPPIVGCIRIGHVVEKDGKRLPLKDDQFTITTQLQNKDGWVLHPMNETLRQGKNKQLDPKAKLREIPVKLLFDDPSLNLRVDYCLFDRHTGRQLCIGNGQTCVRAIQGQEQGNEHNQSHNQTCPTPAYCTFAQQGHCKPYGRLYVAIDDDAFVSDEVSNATLGLPIAQQQPQQPLPQSQSQPQHISDSTINFDVHTFVFRTTGYNSIRTLAAKLSYYQAISNNNLSGLPLQLKLRGKSTTQSKRTPIYFVDLTLRTHLNLQQSLAMAQQNKQAKHNMGFNQAALDEAARLGYTNSVFELSDDAQGELAEFLVDSDASVLSDFDKYAAQTVSPIAVNTSLKSKISEKLEMQKISQT